MDRHLLVIHRTLTPHIGSDALRLQLAVSALAQLHSRWPLAGCALTLPGVEMPFVVTCGRN